MGFSREMDEGSALEIFREKVRALERKEGLPFFLESKSDEDKWAEQPWLFVNIHVPLYLGKCCCRGRADPSETLFLAPC